MRPRECSREKDMFAAFDGSFRWPFFIAVRFLRSVRFLPSEQLSLVRHFGETGTQMREKCRLFSERGSLGEFVQLVAGRIGKTSGIIFSGRKKKDFQKGSKYCFQFFPRTLRGNIATEDRRSLSLIVAD